MFRNRLTVLTLCLLTLLVFPALAGNATQENTTASVAVPVYPVVAPYRISQGDTVYLNDTVDISGVVGWGEQIVWCGGYRACDEGDTPFAINLPTTKQGYYNFYIDPQLFRDHTGNWYQWYGHYEPSGNLISFKVAAMYRNSTMTYSNGTVVNLSVGVSNATEETPIKSTILPEIPVTDYLLAVGDPLFVDTQGPGKVWIFGRVDSLYDVETIGNNLTIPAKEFASFETGDYSMLIQTAGKNGEYDVRFKDGSIQWSDKWNGVKSYSTAGIQPKLVVGKLQDIIGKTDDKYTIVDLEVQAPTLTVIRMDEVGLGSREIEFRDEPGLVTFYDVRGYSNLMNGTKLNAYLDKKDHNSREIKYFTFPAEVVKTAPGNQSMYQVMVPIIWDKMTPGVMHTITVEGPFGTKVYADFPVEVMPADSFRPNATLKYSGSRNPWVAPTVINNTITVKETVKVVERVTVPVTPAPEVVYAQQKKALDDTVTFWGLILVGLIVVIAGGWYIVRVYRRANEE